MQALHTLGRAGRQLREVLPPLTLVTAAGDLLTAVCEPLVQGILDKHDISIDDCREVCDLLQPIVEEGLLAACGPPPAAAASHLSPSEAGKASDSAPPPEEAEAFAQALQSAVRSNCTAFRKLAAVLSTLDAKLMDIVQAWESKRLQESGLKRREVEQLIGALFEDTDYRARCLARLAAACAD